MERDANVDKKKQMTLTFQMRKEGAFFDVLSFCLKDSKHGISSLINITTLLMNTMHVNVYSNVSLQIRFSKQMKNS